MHASAKKIILISFVSALVIVSVGFMVTQVNGDTYIPDEFFTQQAEGAGEAKNVARLVSDSLTNLKKIEAYDKNGETARALELLNYERSTTKEKQDAAVRLSSHLERMAKVTEDIQPSGARELSVEAVSAGVAMVSRIISYNSLLESLYEALSAKFSGLPYTGPTVKQIVDRINTEAASINQLSEKFNSALEEFNSDYVN